MVLFQILQFYNIETWVKYITQIYKITDRNIYNKQ